jgi:hypothetical protein
MHQHVSPLLPPVPHSNALPQRPQAIRRSGRFCPEGGVVIASSWGVIDREINHSVVTALRRQGGERFIHSIFFHSAQGMAAAGGQ